MDFLNIFSIFLKIFFVALGKFICLSVCLFVCLFVCLLALPGCLFVLVWVVCVCLRVLTTMMVVVVVVVSVVSARPWVLVVSAAAAYFLVGCVGQCLGAAFDPEVLRQILQWSGDV